MKLCRKKGRKLLKKTVLWSLVMSLLLSNMNDIFNVYAKAPSLEITNSSVLDQPVSSNEQVINERIPLSEEITKQVMQKETTINQEFGITNFYILQSDFLNDKGEFDVYNNRETDFTLRMEFSGFPTDSTPDKDKKIVIALNRHFKFRTFPTTDGYESLKSYEHDERNGTITYILQDDLSLNGNFTLDFTIRTNAEENYHNDIAETEYTMDAKYYSKMKVDAVYGEEPSAQQSIAYTYAVFNEEIVSPELKKQNEFNILGFHAENYEEAIPLDILPKNKTIKETEDPNIGKSEKLKVLEAEKNLEDRRTGLFIKTPQLILPLPEGVEFICESKECTMGTSGGIGKMENGNLVVTYKDSYRDSLFNIDNDKDVTGTFKFKEPTPGKVYASSTPAYFRGQIMGKEYTQELAEKVNFRIPDVVGLLDVENLDLYEFYGDSGSKEYGELLVRYGIRSKFRGGTGRLFNDGKPMDLTFSYLQKNKQINPTIITNGKQESLIGKGVDAVEISVLYNDGTRKEFSEQNFEYIEKHKQYGVDIEMEGKTVEQFDVVIRNLNLVQIKGNEQTTIDGYLFVYGDVKYVDNKGDALTADLVLREAEYSLTPAPTDALDIFDNFTNQNGVYMDTTPRKLGVYLDDLKMNLKGSVQQVDITSSIASGQSSLGAIGKTNGEVSFFLLNSQKSVNYKNLVVHPQIGRNTPGEENVLMPLYDEFYFDIYEGDEYIKYGDAVFTLNTGEEMILSIDEESVAYSEYYKKMKLPLQEGTYVVDYYFTIKELNRPKSDYNKEFNFMVRSSSELEENMLKDGTQLPMTFEKKDAMANYLKVSAELTSSYSTKKLSGYKRQLYATFSQPKNIEKATISKVAIDGPVQATGNMNVPMEINIKTVGDKAYFKPNFILKVDSNFKINEDSISIQNPNGTNETTYDIKSYYKDGNQYVSIIIQSPKMQQFYFNPLKIKFEAYISPELPIGANEEQHKLISDIYVSGDESMRKEYATVKTGYTYANGLQLNQAYSFVYDNLADIDIHDADNDGKKDDLIYHSTSDKTIPIYPIKEFGIFSMGSSQLINNASNVMVHTDDYVQTQHVFNGNPVSTLSDLTAYIPIPKKGRVSIVADGSSTKEVVDEFDSYLTKEVTISNPELNRDNVEILYTTAKNPEMEELYEGKSDHSYVGYDEVKDQLENVTMIKVRIDALGTNNTNGISKVVVDTDLRVQEKEKVNTLAGYQNVRYLAFVDGDIVARENQFANTVKIELIDYTISGSLWYDRDYNNEIGDQVTKDELADVTIRLKHGNVEQTSGKAILNSETNTYDYQILTPRIEADTTLVLDDIPAGLQLIFPGDNPKFTSSFDRTSQEVPVIEDKSKQEIENHHAGFSDVRAIQGEDIALQQGTTLDLITKTFFNPDYLSDELGVVADYQLKSGNDIIELDGTTITAKKSGEAIVIARIANGLTKSDGTIDGYIEKEINITVYTKRISVSIPKEMKYQVVTNATSKKPEFVSPSYFMENLASPVDFELLNIIDKDHDSKMKLTHNAITDNGFYEMSLGLQSKIKEAEWNADLSIDDMDLTNFTAIPLGHLNGLGSKERKADLLFTSKAYESSDLPEKHSDSYTRNMNLIFKFTLSEEE